MSWIDVNEQLPEKPKFDWVFVKVKMIPEGYYGVPQIAELRRGKWHNQFLDEPLEEWLHVKVTHWRPIPEE